MLGTHYVRLIAIGGLLLFLGAAFLYARYEATRETPVTLQRPADGDKAAPAAKVAPPAPAAPAAAVEPVPQMPPPAMLLAMLRATMLAVDHGMKTGNYTVLRDLSAADFRKANSAAKLAQIFGSLPGKGVDLLAVAVVDPAYTKDPRMTDEHMIYLTGIFPIQPRKAAFEVLFRMEDGAWRLDAIAIAPAAP